jgi:hypothetical protein
MSELVATACFALTWSSEGACLPVLDQVIITSPTATIVQMTNLKAALLWVIANPRFDLPQAHDATFA